MSDPVTECLALYALAQLGKRRPQSFEKWAISGIKNPKPLLDWYAKRAA